MNDVADSTDVVFGTDTAKFCYGSLLCFLDFVHDALRQFTSVVGFVTKRGVEYDDRAGKMFQSTNGQIPSLDGDSWRSRK
jgi:hypothetical protein